MSRVLSVESQDVEKITSDGMMNKQTQTFNCECFFFLCYII